MTKLEIFDDIVSVMEKDSATCKDKGAGDFPKYRAQISEDMPDETFTLTLQRYLASFRVPSHLTFFKASSPMLPFEARRIGDALFVLNADAESGFCKGDKLTALDGSPIPAVAKEYAELLYGETNERQLWGRLIRLFQEATVENPDKTHRIQPIKLVAKRTLAPREAYEFTRINDSAVMLRFDNFEADEPVHSFLQAHETDLSEADVLIIDVRENAGGTDSAFYPLLDYCFREGETPGPLQDEQEINFSDRNVDLRMALLKQYQPDLAPGTFIGDLAAQMQANRGKGFLLDAETHLDIKGRKKPERIFILSDCYCGSSGDAFVEIARLSQKVTVVGRPTMGILDYSNEALITYGDYMFLYPTSRRLALDRGISMAQKGVPVDIYVPFSQQHLYRDVDLEKVLDLSVS